MHKPATGFAALSGYNGNQSRFRITLDERGNERPPTAATCFNTLRLPRYANDDVLRHKLPVQVAFMQGMLPLQQDDLFPRLLDFIQQCPIWSVNLGELRFSEDQCSRCANAATRHARTRAPPWRAHLHATSAPACRHAPRRRSPHARRPPPSLAGWRSHSSSALSQLS